MAHVATLGTGVLGVSGTSLTVTLGAGAAVGDTAIAALAVTSTMPAITVTDSKGNTWSTTGSSANGATVSVVLAYSTLTAALVAGDTVTFSAGATARTRWAAVIEAFDDLTGVDVAATAASNTAAVSGGVTAATSQADSLVVGAFGLSGIPIPSLTPGAGFTTSGSVDVGAASANRGVVMEWGYVSSAGAQEADGTLSAAVTWAGRTQTFAVTAAPPPTRSGKARVWNGTSWGEHPAKVWNGAAWAVHPMKGRDGSGWVTAR